MSVLWFPSASSVGLMWRVQGPYESIGGGGWKITQQNVWRSVSDLETIQRKRCQCPLLCPDYSWLQQFPRQPADKGVSVICSLSPLTFHPHFSSWFHICQTLLLSTLFKQTPEEIGHNFQHRIHSFTSSRTCAGQTHLSACTGASLCLSTWSSLSFYLNEWAVLHPVRLWFG